MVRSVNENDFDRRFPKGFGRSQTTKTAADDHYPRRLRRLLIRTIDRIEIRIVHPSLSQATKARNFRESSAYLPRPDNSTNFCLSPFSELSRFFMAEDLIAAIETLCGAIRSLPETDELLQNFTARGLDRGRYDATIPIRDELAQVLGFLEPFEQDCGAEHLAELPRLHVSVLLSHLAALQRITDEIQTKCKIQPPTGVVLPSYQGSERRVACSVENAYSQLYSELAPLRRLAIDALAKRASGKTTSPTEGLTGWPLVDRCTATARQQLEKATTEEEFQAVGLFCRETLISLAQAVYDPAKHSTSDGINPSPTDAHRMLGAYFAAELVGGSNQAMRKHSKASLDLANELQHRRTASRREAALCVEATRTVVELVTIISDHR